MQNQPRQCSELRTSNAETNPSTTRIGWTADASYASTAWFEGCLDDVRFYDRVLTLNEIKTLAGNPIPTTSKWGLVLLSILFLTAGSLIFRARKRLSSRGLYAAEQ
ncbi:MAG: IPTL-CTERM sorting domain-containing protein [Planctomycetes bacterium]|nr:IPTL-CTERM sorting domain-containing protein [Planctomycetota bacterium]